MGPLQHDIVTLVRTRTAQTNRQILSWLGRTYDVSPDTIKTTLWRLTRRGFLRRIQRGRYEVAR